MVYVRKSVFSVDIRCDKCKKEALQCISRVEGVDMVKVDMGKKMITVEGEADPASIANQLRRKFKRARLVLTGPYQPPSKEGPKKDEKKTTVEEKKNPIKEKEGETKPAQKKGNGQPAENKNLKEKKDAEKPVQTKDDDKKPVEKVRPGDNKDKRQIRCCPHYPQCTVHRPCHNPQYCGCSACSRRAVILWPRHHPPSASPAEVCYVWNYETPSYCTIC